MQKEWHTATKSKILKYLNAALNSPSTFSRPSSMQSLNSPHHGMGPSMSPGPYGMSSPMGMSAGSMAQCMGSQLSAGQGGRDFFSEAPGSPRSRSAMEAKSYRRSYTHAKPPYRSGVRSSSR